MQNLHNSSAMSVDCKSDDLIRISCQATNSGYNVSWIPFCNKMVLEVMDWDDYVKLTATGIIFFLSLIGNSLLVLLVCRNPNFRASAKCYLGNLAVADMLITCLCMWSHVLGEVFYSYPLGEFMCSSSSMVQATSVLGSVLTLALVSLERAYAIVMPMTARRVPFKRHTALMFLWMVAIVGSLPFIAMKSYQIDTYSDYTDYQCRYKQTSGIYVNNTCVRDGHTFVFYYHIAYSTLLFFLPLFIMVVAYTLIIVKLKLAGQIRVAVERTRGVSSLHDSARKKAVALSCTVLIAFIVCWSPSQALLLYYHILGIEDTSGLAVHEIFFWLIFLGYFNSCLNPIIYAWFSRSFRNELRYMLCSKVMSKTGIVSLATGSTSVGTRTSSGKDNISVSHGRLSAQTSHDDNGSRILESKPGNRWRQVSLVSIDEKQLYEIGMGSRNVEVVQLHSSTPEENQHELDIEIVTVEDPDSLVSHVDSNKKSTTIGSQKPNQTVKCRSKSCVTTPTSSVKPEFYDEQKLTNYPHVTRFSSVRRERDCGDQPADVKFDSQLTSSEKNFSTTCDIELYEYELYEDPEVHSSNRHTVNDESLKVNDYSNGKKILRHKDSLNLLLRKLSKRRATLQNNS